ncbi:MAG: glycosyltransferase, partial [Cyanobacteria bacterium P01_F01_bin.86]
MPDLVFDFSSSPEGGSLRRLHAYVDYFEKSPLLTHFFVSAGLDDPERIYDKVKSTSVAKSNVDKVLVRTRYLDQLKQQPKWFFSYGLPVSRPIGESNWMHISNVLPFSYAHCTLDKHLKRKSWLQQLQFKHFAGNNDVVSGESQFAVDSYQTTTKYTGETFVARNGVTRFPRTHEPREAYALAVGTHSYKRVDLTYELFLAERERLGVHKLKLIGDLSSVPEHVANADYIECYSYLSQEDLIAAFNQASLFISTSEVENSSLAVLEALTLTGKAVLSDIPSHREMLEHSKVREFHLNGRNYLEVEALPE